MTCIVEGDCSLRKGRTLIVVALGIQLAGCMPLATFVGMAPNVVQTAAQIDQAKLLADGASFAGSGKTLTDHALSIATGYDCSTSAVLRGQAICASMCR